MKLRRVQLKWLLRLFSVVLVIALTSLWAGFNPDTVLKLRRKIFPQAMVPSVNLVLELHTVHPGCKHEDLEVMTYKDELSMLKAVNQNNYGQLKQKTDDKYIYLRKGAEFCDSCSKNLFLSIKDKKVAIIRGTPAKPGPIAELTDILIEFLPDTELEDLKRGIPFKGDKEKLQLLEGLNGLVVN